jgi:hypothetical protein
MANPNAQNAHQATYPSAQPKDVKPAPKTITKTKKDNCCAKFAQMDSFRLHPDQVNVTNAVLVLMEQEEGKDV